MPPDDDLDRLLMLVADGELAGEDRERLAQRLRNDPQALERYVRYVALHAWLEWDRSEGFCESTSDGEAEVSLKVGAYQSAATFTSRVQQFARRYSHPARFSMAASAAVLAVLVTTIAFVMHWVNREVIVDRDPSLQFVAELTGMQDLVWADGQIAQQEGAHLVSRHVIALKSGLAEVTFRKGSRVVLEGPATFELRSENAARLVSGKLVAHVPPSAVGFKVETSRAMITDLGTEFGVEVQDDQVETHVFVGEVLVQAGAPDKRASGSSPVRIGAGKAVRVEADSQVKPTPLADQSRFPRRTSFGNLARSKSIVHESASWPGSFERKDPRYVAEHVADGKVDDSNGSYWLGRSYERNEHFTLDLGDKFHIERIELLQTHNDVANDRGTKDFDLWASDKLTEDRELVEPRLIVSGNLPSAAGSGANLPVFVLSVNDGSLKPHDARYVRFVAKTYHGVGCGLNEIRIHGTRSE